MKLSHIPAALDAVRARGEYRTISDLRMESAARGTGRDGTARLVFHSNDYLGMTHEPAVIAAAREALRWGTGSGRARLTSGASFEPPIWRRSWPASRATRRPSYSIRGT